MGALVVWFFFWVVVGGSVGYAIGNSKGRGGEGLILGLLLGIIGWLIVAVMEPSEEVRRARQAEALTLAATVSGLAYAQSAAPLASSSSERASVRACPWCAETIKAAARVCRFCGRDVEPLEVASSRERAVHQERLDAVRDEFPAHYDDAYRCLQRLDPPPANAVAWLYELCNRVSQGAPLEAAAANIPRDWTGRLPAVVPAPVTPLLLGTGVPDDAGDFEAVKRSHPKAYDTGRACLAALSSPPDDPEAWLEELCSRVDQGAPPKLAASRIPLNWQGRT